MNDTIFITLVRKVLRNGSYANFFCYPVSFKITRPVSYVFIGDAIMYKLTDCRRWPCIFVDKISTKITCMQLDHNRNIAGQIFFFKTSLRCSPYGLVVHLRVWFRSTIKYGRPVSILKIAGCRWHHTVETLETLSRLSRGESMCTNYWLTACSSLPRKKCV